MRKIVGIATLVLAAVIAAYVFSLHKALGSVTKLSGANLLTTRWSPNTNTTAGRLIDLGYATCLLPSDISGQLQRVDNSMFVGIAPTEDQPQITFCPPIPENEAETRLLIEQAKALGIKADTYFELRKLALATMPFNLIDALLWGRDKTIREATLLTLKTLAFSSDSEVRFFENDSLGLFISARGNSGSIDLYDKRTGVSQTVLVQGSLESILRISDSLATSYQIVGAPKTSADFEAMLSNNNLPPLSQLSGMHDASLRSEAERLEMVADEVRRRRERRN